MGDFVLTRTITFAPQVLGRHQRRLHSHEKRPKDSGHDRRGVVRSAGGVVGPAVWLEGPGLLGPHQYPTAMHGQPGHWLSDIRHVFHVLRASAGHLVPLLEDIQNSQEKDSQAKSSEERNARTLEVRPNVLVRYTGKVI